MALDKKRTVVIGGGIVGMATDMADWAAFPGFLANGGRAVAKRSQGDKTLAQPRAFSRVERGGSGVRAQAVGRDGGLIDDFFI